MKDESAPGGEGCPGGAGVKGCDGPSELRCGCGSLLAKVVAGAVELKCRRCKRTWRVPLSS
jgi:hypothetical protein